MPPTIQALLAARLDQLESAERTVLEHGAVEGEVFHRGAVQALTPGETSLTTRLTALVRRELVRPDRALLAREDAFRFRHLLIRDAAYDATPKATRADLHERFAAWLEERGADLVELDELLGHHLEQAYRYRTELGEVNASLAERAAERLAAAGRRALARGDVGAAGLLRRAVELLPPEAREIDLELDLADALFWQARLAECETLLRETAARAAARSDRRAELIALLYHVEVRYWQRAGDLAELRGLAEEAIPMFEAARDDRGLMRAWNAVGVVEMEGARMGAMQEAYERAVVHANRAGDAPFSQGMLRMVAGARLSGPTPVEEALGWLEAPENLTPYSLGHRVRLEAMRGNFEQARTLDRQARERAEELGERVAIANGWRRSYTIETLAGDAVAAEHRARRAWELFEAMGNSTWLATPAGDLAHALCALERYEEAEEWSRRCEELGPSVDVYNQMLWRQARAKVLAHRGELPEAERLAREAVALAQQTDMLNAHGDALMDLAEVLELAAQDPRAELEQALALYERKGNVVMAERARARLAECERLDA